ncbi:MAG TPA: hypothetical protein VGI86_06635, partial [Acidimicrobiia bacterium]
MKRRSKFITAVVAGAVLCLGYSATSSSATTAAAPAMFTRTIAGIDLHSSDARVSPELVANSGGGVTPSYESGAEGPNQPNVIFEAGIDLPKGAKVTAVSFTVTPGDRTGCLGEPLVFGSYVPQNAT